MALPTYLQENAARIREKEPQTIQLWSTEIINRYLTSVSTEKGPDLVYNPTLLKITSEFTPKTLQREQVIELYRESLYKGYLATLLWGGLEKVVKSKQNFINAIRHPQEEVEKTLRHILDVLPQPGKIASLFEDLNAPPYKIPGLGYPYYTKLFYFMGQIAPEPLPLVPLIFDKWHANAYCALSIQAGRNNIRDAYPGVKTPAKREDRAGGIQCATGSKLAKLYESFLEDFNAWAIELGVSPHQLEEFVFGLEMKSAGHRNHLNPRVALWKIIEHHYSGDSPKMVRIVKRPASKREAAPKESSIGKKYKRLEEHLKECIAEKEVVLSIQQINDMLNPPGLPEWAFNPKQDFWGSNNSPTHVQKKAWMYNGFKVDTTHLDRDKEGGSVKFYKR